MRMEREVGHVGAYKQYITATKIDIFRGTSRKPLGLTPYAEKH